MLLDREPLEDLVENLEDEDLPLVDPADFADEDWDYERWGEYSNADMCDVDDWDCLMFGPMD